MPKCKVDPALHDQVHRFIRESGLTTNGAAVDLGINRTTFWRFCASGKASPRTRLQLRNAIEKRNSRTAEIVSVAADGSKVQVAQTHAFLRLLADLDLKQIRSACEDVLAAIDAYEAQRTG